MGQYDEYARIFCVRGTQLSPKLKSSYINKIKIFTYIAVVICFFAAFSVSISHGQAISAGEAQDTFSKPDYVVFAIDASNSMSSALRNITNDNIDQFTLNDSIDEILSNSTENKVGLVVWNTKEPYDKDLINTKLTGNATKLKNAVGLINSRDIFGNHTCFADGLIDARNALEKSSNGNEIIIFISDGTVHNCQSNDKTNFCEDAIRANKDGIILYGISGICSNINQEARNNGTIGAIGYIKNIADKIRSQISVTVPIPVNNQRGETNPRKSVLDTLKVVFEYRLPLVGIPLGIGLSFSLPIFVLIFPLKWLPRRLRNPLRRIRQMVWNIFESIRKFLIRLFRRPRPKKDFACRGDMMIKKSVTKNVIPNVIAIDSNGSASEDITIEITLPTERCSIGADVALAIDCSASMYNSDGDKKKRKNVVDAIVSHLRRDSDRVSLLYWNNGQLNKKQSITNEFNLVLGYLDALSSDDQNNLDKGGTNFNELLKGAMDSICIDDRDNKSYTRSVIILSDAVPEGEDGPGGLRFDAGEMKTAIKEEATRHEGKEVTFYSVGIKEHPLGRPILEEIAKLGDDKHRGAFVSIDESDINVIIEKIKDIANELTQFEDLTNVEIIDILPPYLKEPHDFKKICKPIKGKTSKVPMTPAPTVVENSQSYTTAITWDLGTIPANGDIWKITFKARLEFPIPTNMIATSNENIMSQITYNDQSGKEHKILLDPGEIRFKAAIE